MCHLLPPAGVQALPTMLVQLSAAPLAPQVSDLYWMVSNVNRDATRNWKQPDAPDQHNPQLHITLFRCAGSPLRCRGAVCNRLALAISLCGAPHDLHSSYHVHAWQCNLWHHAHPLRGMTLTTHRSKCEVDRSSLGLFYSPNLVSWVLAGMVDYHISLGRHFAYPHMLVDGAQGQEGTGALDC